MKIYLVRCYCQEVLQCPSDITMHHPQYSSFVRGVVFFIFAIIIKFAQGVWSHLWIQNVQCLYEDDLAERYHSVKPMTSWNRSYIGNEKMKT